MTISNILTPKVRTWLYGVAIAAFPLAIAYGIVTDENAALWVAVVGAVLVPGLAVANVATPDEVDVVPDDEPEDAEFGEPVGDPLDVDDDALAHLEPGDGKHRAEG